MRQKPGPARARGGFTLVEIVIALGIVGILFLAVFSLLFTTSRNNQMNREQTLAQNAARRKVELARNQEFGKIFALYNDDPSDDPDGPGTAPGPHFDVPGLAPRADDPDGKPGRFSFPTEAGRLREDLNDPFLELPHDLNGDGTIDSGDHSRDYRILPVTLVVEWRSVGKDTRFTYRTRFIGR